MAGITKTPPVPKTPARLKTNQEDLFCFHPDVILLTLNRMLKVRDTSETQQFKTILLKIFDTTFDVFSKDYSKMKNMTWEQIRNAGLKGGQYHEG